jgi:hypothetical protein
MSIRRKIVYSSKVNNLDSNLIYGSILKKKNSLSETKSLDDFRRNKAKGMVFIKSKLYTSTIYYTKYKWIDTLKNINTDKLYKQLSADIKNDEIIEVNVYVKSRILSFILLLRFVVVLLILNQFDYILIDLDDLDQKCIKYVYIGFYFLIYLLLESTIIKVISAIYEILKSSFSKTTVSVDERLDTCFEDYSNKEYYCEFRELPLAYWDYPLSNFYIASSNKSYYPCGVVNDIVSLDNIKKVLEKGARFIHLDINHNGTTVNDVNADPIIANGNDKKNILLFIQACRLINNVAWNVGENNGRNSYPLFLYLHFNTDNINVLNKVALYIKNTFAYTLNGKQYTRLLDKQYSYAGQYVTDSKVTHKELGRIPLSELKNKIVIITNKYPLTNSIDELTNATFDTTYESSNIPVTDIAGSDISSTDVSESLIEPTKYILNYEYTDSDYKYNNMPRPNLGFSSKDQMKNYNKINITRVYKADAVYNPKSKYNIKRYIHNIHPLSPFEMGCQFICMNYQKYNSKCSEQNQASDCYSVDSYTNYAEYNSAMQLYMNTKISSTEHIDSPNEDKWAFKNASILLKPLELRSADHSLPKNVPQDPELSAAIQSQDTGFGNNNSF